MRVLWLVAILLLSVGGLDHARADPQQDHIIGVVSQTYRGYLRQAGSDAARKAQLTAIYKRTLKAIQSKPGLGGMTAAHAGNDEMRKVME